MKRFIIILISLIILLATGCDNKSKGTASPVFSLDNNGNYTGFSDLPQDYTVEKAKEDGYYVTQDLETVANEDVWTRFVTDSSDKINTGIRIVQFYEDSDEDPFFLDLFYQDGYYYLFDSSAEKQEKQPYTYLLSLTGKFGNPAKDSGAVVLTDDDSLTFSMVMKSLLSSNTRVINSIPFYRIVMFQ